MLAVLARAASKKRFVKELPSVLPFFEQTVDAAALCDPELAAYWVDKTALAEKNRQAGKVSGKRRRERQEVIREEK